MNKTLGIALGGLAAAGVVFLVVSSEETISSSVKPMKPKTAYQRITGLPKTENITHTYTKDANGYPIVTWIYKGTPVLLGGGGPLINIQKNPWGIITLKSFHDEIAAVFAERRKTLPADANTMFVDKYSKEVYVLPIWVLNWVSGGSIDIATKLYSAVTGVPVDEFGRYVPGHYGESQSLWDATFGNLLKNPLFSFALTAAVIYFSGGTGFAVLAAYNAWEARGRELSVKELALSTARAYVVSQCGEPCGMAFDFGVGVASGDSYDVAAENALLKQMTPEQRQYYEQGKEAYRGIT